MKQLIICEKPSLAVNVCKALAMMGENPQKKEGYFESNGYFVTPAFGHLFTLCDIEEYQANYDPEAKPKWTLDGLPFIPSQFKFKLKPGKENKNAPDAGVKKQFGIIKKLIHSKETKSIIHCGDSDREGEIIVRLILEQAENTKPVFRLWLPDQEEKTIVSSLKNMEDDRKYDPLADEGFARMYIDWLYGINLTRYTSIKYGKMQRVGRVIGAITKAICDRDREIRNFKPQTYFVAVSQEETANKKIELVSKIRFTETEKNQATELCNEYNSLGAKAKDKNTKEKVIPAPKLFSQSSLQNCLSKRFGFSPDTTLKLVQRLYEAGFVSYPRTPTEYMATAEQEKVKNIIEIINPMKNNTLIFKDTKRIFDDSKIESHSAITPTTKIPKDSDFKSTDEKDCYTTIFNRFCAVFYEENCVVQETKIIIGVGDKEDFTLTGIVPIQPGWQVVEKPETKDEDEKALKELPALEPGDPVNINFVPAEKQTTPPKHFTVETLNNYLRNPFHHEKKDAKENDDNEYRNLLDGLEIGTEATRSTIIATAIASNYIKLNKITYTIEPDGETLVDNMATLGIDMSKEKTAMMGKSIKDVYKGQSTIKNVVGEVKGELEQIIGQNVELKRYEKPEPTEKEILGECSRCKQPVLETPKAYSCSARCGFAIWKSNKFLENGKKKLTAKMVRDLLKKGEVKVTGVYSAKSDKKYDCTIVLEDTGTFVNLKPAFGSK